MCADRDGDVTAAGVGHCLAVVRQAVELEVEVLPAVATAGEQE
jgi:hypothetical protein